VGWSDVDWIGLAQVRNRLRGLENSVLNLQVSLKCWETIEGTTTVELSSSAQLHRVSHVASFSQF
jgi:hypothetical protein